MSEWVSIKERLPELEDVQLIYDGKLVDIGYFGSRYWHMLHGELRKGVTHWMPLPPPPTDPVREALRLASVALAFLRPGVNIAGESLWYDATEAIERAEKVLGAE